jgi:hypothetical protein
VGFVGGAVVDPVVKEGVLLRGDGVGGVGLVFVVWVGDEEFLEEGRTGGVAGDDGGGAGFGADGGGELGGVEADAGFVGCGEVSVAVEAFRGEDGSGFEGVADLGWWRWGGRRRGCRLGLAGCAEAGHQEEDGEDEARHAGCLARSGGGVD